MRLKGRRAFVLGGGRGIGRAIALAFAAEGADVVVAARTKNEVDEVAAAVEKAGVRSAALICDVGRAAEVEHAVREAESRLGEIDILVANAGVLHHAPLAEQTDAIWDEALRVNLSSVFWATRAAMPRMAARGWGRVIAMSSVSGKVGGRNRSAYHATKHGVIGFVRSVALEVADRGVTVNAICPGFVNTRMITDNKKDFADFSGKNLGEDETIQSFRTEIPMGRFLEPEEVAQMAVYLASEDARGITGQAFTISCGSVQA
ncbi:MAG: SDR family NAD(P)-dependent oxidoreductase [bacterium]|nr:SDR family NAD(P)-dependent oxidoreductase [bacterium]